MLSDTVMPFNTRVIKNIVTLFGLIETSVQCNINCICIGKQLATTGDAIYSIHYP